MDDGQGFNDGRADFDFLYGRWRVLNRRLVERLVGCDDWIEFHAEYECQPLLGGLGNLDRMFFDAEDGYFEGASLRVFQPDSDEWLIYWVDNRSLELQVPTRGRFIEGVGAFYAEEAHQGTPVRVRFLWTMNDADHASWAQAFSTDEGVSWETNWTMDFTREPAAAG